MASEALASIMSGRSTSPWLARRTSPANSSGDSAIASCHEGGSTYGKEDQEAPKSHESQEETCHDSQPAWPHDYRPVTVKEEQVSPASSSHPRDTQRGAAQSQTEQGAGQTGNGDGPWQPLAGSGRRKNRKNKDTVRHITQQAERNWDKERDRERDSRPGSPLPSMLAVAGWNYNGQDIPGADVTEPNSSDSRGERLDFFLKQEEPLTTEPSFLGVSESEEAGAGAGGGTISSVANLKAALMSKNSLLSLRAEMMGEDSPLLYEYLPKGGHSLSWLRSNHCSSNTVRQGASGATIQNKTSYPTAATASSSAHLSPSLQQQSPSSSCSSPSSAPPTPFNPHEQRPLEDSDMEMEEVPEGLELPTLPQNNEKSQDIEKENCSALDTDQCLVERDQMAEGSTGTGTKGLEQYVEGAPGGDRVLPDPGVWPEKGIACTLCKRLLFSLEQLREHEYHHTLSLMALSLDWPCQTSQTAQPALPSQALPLQQSLYRPALSDSAPTRYFCTQCPASFTLKSNADRHEKTIHMKKKLMQCVYCLKHFRDRTDLHRHLSSVHSREREHPCHTCHKTFSTQKNLATHVKVCCQTGPLKGAIAGAKNTDLSQGEADTLWWIRGFS